MLWLTAGMRTLPSPSTTDLAIPEYQRKGVRERCDRQIVQQLLADPRLDAVPQMRQLSPNNCVLAVEADLDLSRNRAPHAPRNLASRAPLRKGTKCEASYDALIQRIEIFDLTRIAHAATMRTLCKLMTEVRHRNVWPEPLDQAVHSILTAPPTFGAFEADHVELLGNLAQRIRPVRHCHSQLSRRSARSI